MRRSFGLRTFCQALEEDFGGVFPFHGFGNGGRRGADREVLGSSPFLGLGLCAFLLRAGEFVGWRNVSWWGWRGIWGEGRLTCCLCCSFGDAFYVQPFAAALVGTLQDQLVRILRCRVDANQA
jgi:hypothetical protein